MGFDTTSEPWILIHLYMYLYILCQKSLDPEYSYIRTCIYLHVSQESWHVKSVFDICEKSLYMSKESFYVKKYVCMYIYICIYTVSIYNKRIACMSNHVKPYMCMYIYIYMKYTYKINIPYTYDSRHILWTLRIFIHL